MNDLDVTIREALHTVRKCNIAPFKILKYPDLLSSNVILAICKDDNVILYYNVIIVYHNVLFALCLQ